MKGIERSKFASRFRDSVEHNQNVNNDNDDDDNDDDDDKHDHTIFWRNGGSEKSEIWHEGVNLRKLKSDDFRNSAPLVLNSLKCGFQTLNLYI